MEKTFKCFCVFGFIYTYPDLWDLALPAAAPPPPPPPPPLHLILFAAQVEEGS